MIDIKSVIFNKNPCETGEEILLSVEIQYEEDRCEIPAFYQINVSEMETVNVTVQGGTYYECLDGEGNTLTDPDGNELSYIER